jgi:hypothetical protein
MAPFSPNAMQPVEHEGRTVGFVGVTHHNAPANARSHNDAEDRLVRGQYVGYHTQRSLSQGKTVGIVGQLNRYAQAPGQVLFHGFAVEHRRVAVFHGLGSRIVRAGRGKTNPFGRQAGFGFEQINEPHNLAQNVVIA